MWRMLKKTLGGKSSRDSSEESETKKRNAKKGVPVPGGKAGKQPPSGTPWMQQTPRPLTADERQTLIAEHKKDIALVDILSRIVDSGAVTTATIHTQQGKKGRNQDAMVVWEEFLNQEQTTFVGVFDGHGPYGHLVAKRVRDSLPSILSEHLSAVLDEGEKKKGTPKGPGAFSDPLNLEGLKEAFVRAFLEMDRELRSHPMIDSFCSGTTAICALRHDDQLFISNLGDSRIILGSQGPNGQLIATQLSTDLKPDLPEEKRRIRASNGRVFALPDEPDVTRVWLPHEDTPGLAMARAFGDLCLKDYGVISSPDVTHRTLTDDDEFLVLASDGIWDVLENEEVVQLVASLSHRKGAAARIIQAAVLAWREKYPTAKTDDCACIVLFLDGGSLDVASADAAVIASDAKVVNSNGADVAGDSFRALPGAGEVTGTVGQLPEASLIARADSVVNIGAITRAMSDEGLPDDMESDSALIARADSVTMITRKL